MLVGNVYAYHLGGPVVRSGDGGKQFAETKAQELCAQGDTYICNGNIVRLVVNESYYIFYRPDGVVEECDLNKPPSERGGLCMQMLHPNFCPPEPTCQKGPQKEEVAPREKVYAEGESSASEQETAEKEAAREEGRVAAVEESAGQPLDIYTAPLKSNIDKGLENVALLVLGIGALALVVLFVMFKKSMD